jgi:hypothetical protein
VGDVWSGLLLTDTVVAATRLAGSRRPPGGWLDTQTLLLALESADNSGAWSRFAISDLPGNEPGNSDDTFDEIPLTQMCAEALRRARVIAEAYRLVPLPAGALALALVWDPESTAAQSFVGVAHAELIAAVQQDLLGTDLDGLADLLTDRQPSDLPSTGTEPRVSEAEADRTLRRVIALLPTWWGLR